MANRNGKIARLSFARREQLNQRLLDNQPGKTILDWLNALPELLALCEESSQEPVSMANLSNWRAGGYTDWLRRRERVQQTRSLCKWSAQFSSLGGRKVTDGISVLMAEQLFEVMEGLTRAKQEINELEDETERSSKSLSVSKAIAEVARALATIRSGDHERARLAQKDELIAMERERFQRLVCVRLLVAAQSAKIHTIAMSDAEYEAKLEAVRRVAFADVDEMERSGILDKLTPP
jgi:hypothetical protein